MARWLNTRGHTTLAVGICSRCGIKFPLDELQPDTNYPGLRVCYKDLDLIDPYRLPARPADNIVLPFSRPDTPIPTNPSGLLSQDSDDFLISEDGDTFLIVEDDENEG